MKSSSESRPAVTKVTIDFHNHVLGHKYYFQEHKPEKLDLDDKDIIEEFLQETVIRKPEYIAATDHDMLVSGLYAREYARKQGLSVKIIPGMECEIFYKGTCIHLLGLGLEEAPEFSPYTDPRKLIDSIKVLGGIAVLAHPHLYREFVYHDLKNHLDGVEYFNGGVADRGEGLYYTLLEDAPAHIIKTYGSDYHFPELLSDYKANAYSEYDAGFARRLAGY